MNQLILVCDLCVWLPYIRIHAKLQIHVHVRKRSNSHRNGYGLFFPFYCFVFSLVYDFSVHHRMITINIQMNTERENGKKSITPSSEIQSKNTFCGPKITCSLRHLCISLDKSRFLISTQKRRIFTQNSNYASLLNYNMCRL